MKMSPENIALALRLAAEGYTIKKIREAVGVSPNTFMAIRKQNAEFEKAFVEARNEGLEELADTLLDIADDSLDVLRARLKSENLRWILSKRKPLVYGDRLDVNINETVNLAGALEAARQRAMLPMCDPRQLIDIQDAEIISESVNIQTDSKSVSDDDIDIFS